MRESRKTYLARLYPKGHVLDSHRVSPPGPWVGVSTRWMYPKECNDRAGKFLLDNFAGESARDDASVRLVHGYYQPLAMPLVVQHAWADLGNGVVFDGVLQGFYDTAGYAKAYRTEEVVRYTVREMARLMGEHEHWGPWHPAIRGTKPPPLSAMPEPDAYITIGGLPRLCCAHASTKHDGYAMVSLREDVGAVGSDYYLPGDGMCGKRIGMHDGKPLYESVSFSEMSAANKRTA